MDKEDEHHIQLVAPRKDTAEAATRNGETILSEEKEAIVAFIKTLVGESTDLSP